LRIELRVEGGLAFLPGLSQPTTIDTAALPDTDAAEIESLVSSAHFQELPAQLTPRRGAADFQTYTITVDDHGVRKTVQTTDVSDNPALQRLVEKLQALARGEQRP
jgi:hypothetical protein